MAQAKVNKHGYMMTNLREICSQTKYLRPYGPFYMEIAYDTETGKVLSKEHLGAVGSSFVRWDDGILACGFLTERMSQQEIADVIANKLGEYHRLGVYPE